MYGMKSQNLAILVAFIPYALGLPHLENFLGRRSPAGLSSEGVRFAARDKTLPGAQPLPPPVLDTSAKLVYDEAHPFVAAQPGDARGPCPGLNTLASHGYINHNGVVTPAEMITAVQEGFNMGYQMAAFSTFSAFMVDGNHLANLISIGENVTVDGQLITGLNTHGTFEGDVSSTRSDNYLGNNHDFNETLFDQLVYAANLVGNGLITLESASYHKSLRINDSMARNPTFTMTTPRYLTAYRETTFPLAFFVSNQTPDTGLGVNLDDARTFFENDKYPDGFIRRQGSYDFTQYQPLYREIYNMIGVPPGRNEGAVNNYVVDPTDNGNLCEGYHKQLNRTAQLYPNPTPQLKEAIKQNMLTFYQVLADTTCEQYFPYGQ